MFTPDVVSLKQFYATPLGAVAQILLSRHLRRMWPDAPREATLGIGFATPYLPIRPARESVAVACMPALQGAMYWPHGQANRTALAHESALPFSDAGFNRVLLVHMVEHSEQLRGLMEEVWRVLVPGGRVLIVVPNRHGLWNTSAKSPFGYGRPFSISQMKELLDGAGITFLRSGCALYFPPTRAPWLLRIASYVEEWIGPLLPRFGGVLLVEAEKQIYAAVAQQASMRRTVRMPARAGAQPVFTPQQSPKAPHQP